MRKSVGLFAVSGALATVFVVILSGCGGKIDPSTEGDAGRRDSGKPADTGAPHDSGLEDTSVEDTSVTFPDSFFPVDTFVIEDTSTPDDVDIPDVFTEDSPPATCASDTPFTAFPWAPPTPLHQNACSSAELTAYLNALQSSTGTGTVTSGNARCDACLQTDEGASAHGPILTVTGQPAELNFGGCVADIDGQKGAGSCGNALNNENDCVDQECAMCSDFNSMTQPMTQACEQAVFAQGGPCAGPSNTPNAACNDEVELMGDGGAAVCEDFMSLFTLWCGP